MEDYMYNDEGEELMELDSMPAQAGTWNVVVTRLSASGTSPAEASDDNTWVIQLSNVDWSLDEPLLLADVIDAPVVRYSICSFTASLMWLKSRACRSSRAQ
jgi:hypothetical protein